MTRIRAVLFDVDGTLIDRRATLAAFLTGHMERLGISQECRGTYVERYLELDAEGSGDRVALAATLAREFPLPGGAGALLLDVHRHLWARPRATSGAADLLHDLRARGLRVGAVTNGLTAAQHAKLHRAGLRALLETVVVGTPRGPRKPHSAVFLQAAHALNTPPEACLMVGDQPEADVLGAQGAGLCAAWLSGGRAWPAQLSGRPDFTLSHLGDLRARLRDREG